MEDGRLEERPARREVKVVGVEERLPQRWLLVVHNRHRMPEGSDAHLASLRQCGGERIGVRLVALTELFGKLVRNGAKVLRAAIVDAIRVSGQEHRHRVCAGEQRTVRVLQAAGALVARLRPRGSLRKVVKHHIIPRRRGVAHQQLVDRLRASVECAVFQFAIFRAKYSSHAIAVCQ